MSNSPRRVYTYELNGKSYLYFYCSVCNHTHSDLEWNKSVELPTIESVIESENLSTNKCVVKITDGKIEYLKTVLKSTGLT